MLKTLQGSFQPEDKCPGDKNPGGKNPGDNSLCDKYSGDKCQVSGMHVTGITDRYPSDTGDFLCVLSGCCTAGSSGLVFVQGSLLCNKSVTLGLER